MFTKTSGSKRFTFGILRFLANLFQFTHVPLCTALYMSDSVNSTLAILSYIFGHVCALGVFWACGHSRYT
jgi:hypothetical protein